MGYLAAENFYRRMYLTIFHLTGFSENDSINSRLVSITTRVSQESAEIYRGALKYPLSMQLRPNAAIAGWVLAASMFLASLGCTPGLSPYLFLQYGKELQALDVAKVLAENPLGADENIKITALGGGQAASHHLVQIRDREVPHVHKAHDATVLVVRGRGYLIMDTRRINLSAGDIVHIPRGAAHYYVNSDLQPTVVFVTYAPPYDGKDNFPVKMP
jgi:mannose-6-phosphate isomerase-like protein (cupin superfamily)